MSPCNVGSLTPYDAAQWVEYMTSEREGARWPMSGARTAAPSRGSVKYLGIGNETWGCGGNMSAEYAADVNRRYSTFVNAPRRAWA